jgi:hypothetical protein
MTQKKGVRRRGGAKREWGERERESESEGEGEGERKRSGREWDRVERGRDRASEREIKRVRE